MALFNCDLGAQAGQVCSPQVWDACFLRLLCLCLARHRPLGPPPGLLESSMLPHPTVLPGRDRQPGALGNR